MSKINGLVMKDKELVKKYQGEVARKRNLDKLEIKWRKYDSTKVESYTKFEPTQVDEFKKIKGEHAPESWDRVKKFFSVKSVGDNADSVDEYVNGVVDSLLEDEDTVKLGEIGGWRAVAGFITDYEKKTKDMQSGINKTTTAIEKLVKEYDKAANDAAKASVADRENSDKATAVETANKEYDMAQAYQTAVLADMQAAIKVNNILYKQNKAAFMKAIAANEKNLEESSIYAQAVAEAAEDVPDS